MIPVTRQPEPVNFNLDVRIPGEAFLRFNRKPKSKDFRGHSYWQRVLPQMITIYSARCAYSAMPVLGDASIDHFMPKVEYPTSAYSWANYRLCSSKLNGKKGNDLTVLDPFTIQPGWFELDLASLFVRGSPQAPPIVRPRIQRTIEKLDLNSTALVTVRFNIYSAYLRNNDLTFVKEFYPFIANEIVRQAPITEDLTAGS